MKIHPNGYWYDADNKYAYGWSLPLAEWIAEYLKPHAYYETATALLTPIYDFGCGPGNYLATLAAAGFLDVTGYEGEPLPVEQRAHANIVKRDLTEPFTVGAPGHVVCLEVAEHVPAQHEATLIENIARAVAPGCKLILSWALPDQGGIGHVNQRSNEYAIGRLTLAGFVYLPTATAAARAVEHPGCQWFRNTLMVFQKAEAAA